MTREKRWTPGPWRVHTRAFAHVTSEYGAIANCGDWKDYSREHEQVPNAHLIAAAPELVEALEEALDELSDIHASFLDGIYNNPRINSAIAKAYGETEED